MGFYYGSNEPPDDPGQGGWRETITIIFVVFRVLAVPLAILMGAIFALFALFWLFTVHVLLGFGIIGILVGALTVRGIWEAKHPPDFG
jgi:hypothetical protein